MKHMTCKLKDIPNLNVSPLLWYYKNFYAHCYVIFWESNLRYNIVLHLNIWFLGNCRLFKMKCSVCWLILSINVSWVLRKQILQLTLSWYPWKCLIITFLFIFKFKRKRAEDISMKQTILRKRTLRSQVLIM